MRPLVCLLVTGLIVAAEPVAWFHTADQAGLQAWQPLVTLTTVADDPWLQDAGLQAGDRIVAVDSQPVCSGLETNWLIGSWPGTAARLPIQIERQGQRLTCQLRHPLSIALPFRWLHLSDEAPTWAAIAKRCRHPVEPPPLPVPARIRQRLWHHAASEPAATGSLLELIKAGLATVAGQPKVKTGTSDDPLIQAWLHLLERAAGQLITDEGELTLPADAAPELALFGYPWRGITPPAVGDWPDAAFAKTLHRRWFDPIASIGTRLQQAEQIGRGAAQGPGSHHLATIQAGLLAPDQWLTHGWRSGVIRNQGERQRLIRALTEQLREADEDDVPLLCLALIPALASEHRSEEVAVLVRRLHATNPLLAHLGLHMVARIDGTITTRFEQIDEDLAAVDLVILRPQDPLVQWLQFLPTVANQPSWFRPIMLPLQEAKALPVLFGSNGRLRLRLTDNLEQMHTEFNNMAWDFATDERTIDADIAAQALPIMLHQARWEMKDFKRDTVASLYARIGNFDEAVWWQAQCLREAQAPGSGHHADAIADFTKRLLLYQAGKPALEVAAQHQPEQQVLTYDNGAKREEQTVFDNVPSGRYRSWRVDGTLHEEGWLIEGRRNGHWRIYDTHGILHEDGWYRDDQRIGPWRVHAADGTVFCSGSYATLRRGISNRFDNWTWFDADGEAVVVGLYGNGNRIGSWRRRTADGWTAGRAAFITPPTLGADGQRRQPQVDAPDAK